VFRTVAKALFSSVAAMTLAAAAAVAVPAALLLCLLVLEAGGLQREELQV